MNRLAALFVVCGVLLFAGTVGQSAQAQSEPPMTEQQIEHIRQHCVAAQTTLNQLHVSDALLWVNRNQLYEHISSKLMAPLNSRIALNRLGGLQLATTTLEYDRQLNGFRDDYRQYDQAMTRTLEIQCVDQPVTFYDSLKESREKRLKVHGDTNTLNALIGTYKTNFDDFEKEIQKDRQ